MSDVYPSQADLYDSGGLMRMAGSLAEKAESDLTDLSGGGNGHPLTHVIARALIANAYATLAHTAAVRERTDIIADTFSAEPGAQPDDPTEPD